MLLLPTLLLISCGSQKPNVSDVKFKSFYVENDLNVSLTADLTMGNVLLPSVTIPVTDNGKDVGSVTLVGATGKNQIQVNLNVSQAAGLQAQDALLPNGNALPIIGSKKVIAIPVDKTAIVYLSIDGQEVAIGVSVAVKTFDDIGKNVGSVGIFPVFNENNVVGAAGTYFSKTRGKNGIALFADLSGAIGSNAAKSLGFDTQIQAEQASLNYNSVSTSRSKKRKINRAMYKLNKKRKRLRLH